MLKWLTITGLALGFATTSAIAADMNKNCEMADKIIGSNTSVGDKDLATQIICLASKIANASAVEESKSTAGYPGPDAKDANKIIMMASKIIGNGLKFDWNGALANQIYLDLKPASKIIGNGEQGSPLHQE